MRRRRGKRRSIRQPLLWAAVAFVLGFFLFTSGARGQSVAEVRAKLEKTDALMDKARDIVSEVGSVRGRGLIGNAERLQRRAWNRFNMRHMQMAMRMTLRAREDIYNALNSVRQSQDNENEVERQLERTDRILQELRDRVGRQGPARPGRLESVLNLQRRAWDLYRERRLRPALKLTLQARDMTVRMTDARGGMGPGAGRGAIDIETRIERLSEALDRTGERVHEAADPRAVHHWEQARALLKQARDAMETDHPKRADRLLRQTRDQLDRAVQTVGDGVKPERVEALIRAARDRWERFASPVREMDDKRLLDWHRQAGELLDRAQRALGKKKPGQALVQTRRAVNLLNKISDQIGL